MVISDLTFYYKIVRFHHASQILPEHASRIPSRLMIGQEEKERSMRTSGFKVFLIWHVVIILAAIFITGCHKFKNIFVRPQPEGVELRSYTIRLSGYEQIADVKASEEEILQYISNPANFSMQLGEARTGSGRERP